jgi:hypothetical protein
MERVGVLALALATRKNVLADSSLAGPFIVLAISNTPNGIRCHPRAANAAKTQDEQSDAAIPPSCAESHLD